jgi:hypothetical protein
VSLAVAFAFLPVVSQAQTFTRAPAESARSFADRTLHLPAPADGDDIHVLETKWNGHAVLFVDYPEQNDRMVVALEQQPDGAYRKVDVTDGEEEGGLASVAAIGFAKAEKSPDQQLIVILAWPVQHAVSEGTLYEVRIFEDAKPGQTALTLLKPISDKLSANGCDCDQDGKTNHFRFKTIAAVKAELKRLGF